MGTLYENIKSLCDEHKITGGKMCVALGLSKSLMTKLKNEPEREISSDTALKIANYFKVSTDRVLYGEKKKKKEPTPKNESGQGLPAGYDKLTPENKAIVDRLIVDLANNQSKH